MCTSSPGQSSRDQRYPSQITLSPFPAARPQTKTMTVDDVIRLSKAGLSDDVIIQHIKKKDQRFDLSTDQLLRLKSASVSERVIQVMIEPTKEPALLPAHKAGSPAPQQTEQPGLHVPTTTEGKKPPTSSHTQQPSVPADTSGQNLKPVSPQLPKDSKAESIVVQGHTIGESIDDYAGKVGFDLSECRQLLSAGKINRSQKKDKKICEGLVSAAGGARVIFGPQGLQGYQPGTIQWAFTLDRGKLAEIDMTTIAVEGVVTFSQAMEDLIRKYGEPTGSGTKSSQNGLGNTFETGYAGWKLADSVILAEEGFFAGNVRLRTITVVFLSPEESMRRSSDYEKRPNIF